MIGLLLGLVLQAARAEEPSAADPDPADPADPAPAAPALSPEEQLQRAVEIYLSGEAGEARNQLQTLLGQGPDLSPAIRQEALAWLGDILYSEEGEAAARNVFLVLLAENPAYTLDSFRHPPEVVRYMERLQASMQPDVQPPTRQDPAAGLPSRPWPALTLAPGGLYYFRQGRPAVGAALTTLQVGTLATSTVLYFELSTLPRELEIGQEAEIQRARTLRALNWAVGISGWLCVAVPVVYETAKWNRELRIRSVQLQAGPGALQVAGTF